MKDDINFQLEQSVGVALAISKGWEPMIEDMSQEMVGDSYPMIPNPVTYQEFISSISEEFITSVVLDTGRKHILADFKSIFDSVEHQINNGAYDQLIINGDFDGIKNLVKSSL